MRKWTELSAEEAEELSREELNEIEMPLNERGEPCSWPWYPELLPREPWPGRTYRCPCGTYVTAGALHPDFREALECNDYGWPVP